MTLTDSAVFVLGPYYGGDFSTGIDDRTELARLPEQYSGGILTNVDGTAYDPHTPDALVSNGPLHPVLLAALRTGPNA